MAFFFLRREMNLYLYQDKLKIISSEELLKKALKAYNSEYHLGYSSKEIEEAELYRTERGKPYFKDISLEFSISHSGNIWVCVIGENRVGVDIQVTKTAKTIEVAKRFFTTEEADFITDNDRTVFFQIWSRKEAFVKFTGEGISYGFDKFSVIKDGEINDNLEIPFKCHLERIQLMDDYECCICSEEKETIWIRDL